jgi:hypothetical protein
MITQLNFARPYTQNNKQLFFKYLNNNTGYYVYLEYLLYLYEYQSAYPRVRYAPPPSTLISWRVAFVRGRMLFPQTGAPLHGIHTHPPIHREAHNILYCTRDSNTGDNGGINNVYFALRAIAWSRMRSNNKYTIGVSSFVHWPSTMRT